MRIDFPFRLLYLLRDILGFQLGRPPLLIHNVDSLLFTSNLAVHVLELAAKPLRHLRFGGHSLLQVLVLHHLFGCGASEVCHLRVQFTLQIVQTNILMLLLLVSLL